MVKRKRKNRAAVVDSSFFRPILFSLSEGNLENKDLECFFQGLDTDFYPNSLNIHEFAAGYAYQSSLFSRPLATVNRGALWGNDAIYLSSVGEFSLTPSIDSLFSFDVSLGININQQQPNLWQTSVQWQKKLSFEDKNIIALAHYLGNTYDEVAILTNDWALRGQCTSYEMIDVYGTCSLLAGLVLNNTINYQRGTYIYQTWLNREPRWVPTAILPNLERRKWTFGEILELERKRISQNKSFWLSS